MKYNLPAFNPVKYRVMEDIFNGNGFRPMYTTNQMHSMANKWMQEKEGTDNETMKKLIKRFRRLTLDHSALNALRHDRYVNFIDGELALTEEGKIVYNGWKSENNGKTGKITFSEMGNEDQLFISVCFPHEHDLGPVSESPWDKIPYISGAISAVPYDMQTGRINNVRISTERKTAGCTEKDLKMMNMMRRKLERENPDVIFH